MRREMNTPLLRENCVRLGMWDGQGFATAIDAAMSGAGLVLLFYSRIIIMALF